MNNMTNGLTYDNSVGQSILATNQQTQHARNKSELNSMNDFKKSIDRFQRRQVSITSL